MILNSSKDFISTKRKMFKISGLFQFSLRTYASPNRIKPFRKPRVHKKIESEAISLQAKGFLRPQRPYDPPNNVEQQIETIVKELNITDLKEKKFEFLNQCSIVFNGHAVPNSQLYEFKTINDVIKFYYTPVNCRTPYEEIDKSIPNLHVIPEARRYNPETDGNTAFPKSSTLVTGLKYRKKYQGNVAKTSWPFI